MNMRSVHQWFAWAMVVANALAGGWCLAAHRYERLRGRVLWGFVLAAQLTVFVQALLGVLVIQLDHVKVTSFHLLYGASGIVAVAILYSYRQQMERHRFLLYGGGSLFIMGLGLRAMTVVGI